MLSCQVSLIIHRGEFQHLACEVLSIYQRWDHKAPTDHCWFSILPWRFLIRDRHIHDRCVCTKPTYISSMFSHSILSLSSRKLAGPLCVNRACPGRQARDAAQPAITIPTPAVSTKPSEPLVGSKTNGQYVSGLSHRCGQTKPSLVAVNCLSA